MQIANDSVHHRILDHLCTMPKAVRGMSMPMLQREFGSADAVEDLITLGLIKRRGWSDGPGSILVPTAEGEALHQNMQAPRDVSKTAGTVTGSDRVILP